MVPGTRVRDYIFEKKIGQGGMGEVWQARHALLDRLVAVKIMADNIALDPNFEKRFLREARAMDRLEHSRIVGVREFFTEAGHYYLIMTLLQGRSLEKLIADAKGPMVLPIALQIATDILQALDYAHQKGIIHRDVKPSNILLDKEGNAYLTDFGIALMVGESRQTKSGAGIGTPHYMSPEQISNPRAIDHRSDEYSMGCVIYEMLTGRPPFDDPDSRESDFTVMLKHIQAPPIPPNALNPRLPQPLVDIVLKALSKNPNDRFPGCGVLCKAIQEYLDRHVGPAGGDLDRTVAGDFAPVQYTARLMKQPKPAWAQEPASAPDAPEAAQPPVIVHAKPAPIMEKPGVRPQPATPPQTVAGPAQGIAPPVSQPQPPRGATPPKVPPPTAAQTPPPPGMRTGTPPAPPQQHTPTGRATTPPPITPSQAQAMAGVGMPHQPPRPAGQTAATPPPQTAWQQPPPQTAQPTGLPGTNPAAAGRRPTPPPPTGEMSGTGRLDKPTGGKAGPVLSPRTGATPGPAQPLRPTNPPAPTAGKASKPANKKPPQKHEPAPAASFQTKGPAKMPIGLIIAGGAILVVIVVVLILLFSGKKEPITAPEPSAATSTTSPTAAPQGLLQEMGMTFKKVPAGQFKMGADSGKEEEKPAHTVTISKDFYISATEVTEKQWRLVTGEKPPNNRGDDYPVDGISWIDAQRFLKKLGEKTGKAFRLPTEAEWEYACRAGETAEYAWGPSFSGDNCWFSGNSGGKPQPVGQKPANKWGLVDMAGNVWEWCQDWYAQTYYQESPGTDPSGPASGTHRVVRGGCYDSAEEECRSAYRAFMAPDTQNASTGLRIVSNVPIEP